MHRRNRPAEVIGVPGSTPIRSVPRVVTFSVRMTVESTSSASKRSESYHPSSADAGVYGFLANIFFYTIDTPLREFVRTHHNLVRHCEAIHAAVTAG